MMFYEERIRRIVHELQGLIYSEPKKIMSYKIFRELLSVNSRSTRILAERIL